MAIENSPYKINYDECYHLFLTRVLTNLGLNSGTMKFPEKRQERKGTLAAFCI
jgi:hypothetical protein